MTHETLVCQENISADTLSALRDQALPEVEAARLRAHISTCAACQARLAGFDHVAAALRAQRELDPGDRVLAGVQARIAEHGPAPRGGRVIWNMGSLRRMTGGQKLLAGLAALAPVAAIILLFVYVFGAIGQHPATNSTPTVSVATPTPTWFKKISPTQTPSLVVIPPYTQATTATAAWGAGALTPSRQFTIASSGLIAFQPELFSSDFSIAGGGLVTVGANAPPPYNPPLALYNTTTRAITKLGPTGGMVMMDNQYIVYDYDTAPGATCGPCHQSLWLLNRTTGRTWEFDPGPKKSGSQEVLYSGVFSALTSAGHVAFLTLEGQVWVADLATQTVKLTLPIGSQPANASTILPQERLIGFQWPYLIYDETPVGTPDAQGNGPPDTLNILDLVTGANTRISAQISLQNPHPAYMSVGLAHLWLVGTTLYGATSTQVSGVDAQGKPVNATYGELYRLDNAFAPGGQFTFLARWSENAASPQFTVGGAPNSRLIDLSNGYIWDLAENRLVSTAPVAGTVDGRYIVVEDAEPQNSYPRTFFHFALYDISALAVR